MGKLIFFVDDDKMMLNLLEYTIKNRHECEIMTYFSGEDCLANLDKHPDLIVLDHYFKGTGSNTMNGMDTLMEIRKKDNRIPVIILTSHEEKTLEDEYYRKGATKFLPKNDYFIDSLIESIEAVV